MDAGKIIIGTEIDNTKLEKQLAQLEKQQGKLKDQKIKLDLDNTKALNNLQKIDDKLEIINQKIATLEENNIPEKLVDNLEYQDLINQRGQLNAKGEEYLQQLDMIKSKQNDINESMKANETSIEIINTRLNNMPINLDGISNGITKIVRKIGKWTLALFGIRTAYTFIRQMINQATQQNEELANKLQYIKFAISTVFEPIAKFVIDIIYDIIAGLGAIIKLITGINIFSKATAKNFKKANQSAGSLKKTLAGFDEASVLNGGSGGLANGILGDSNKLPDLSTEIDKFSKKIKDWITGGYDNMFAAIIEESKKVPQRLLEIFKPVYRTIIKPYIVDPFVDSLKYMWSSIEPYVRPIWNSLKIEWDNTINYLKPVWSKFVDSLSPVWDKFKEKIMPSVTQPFVNAIDYLKKLFAPFFNDIIKWINQTFGFLGIKLDYIETEWEDQEGKVKDVKKEVNGIASSINNISNKKINIVANTSSLKSLNNLLDDILLNIEAISGQKVKTRTWTTKANPKSAKGSIIYPKLAMGGIVSMPGRGVLYGGATIAERGAEAVLPLTDSQQMALLGEAIGKYITINANIVNTMNGRVISKELQKVQNDNDFAYNR